MDKPIDDTALPKALKFKLKGLGFLTVGNVLNNSKFVLSGIDSRTSREIHAILTREVEQAQNSINLINPSSFEKISINPTQKTHECNSISIFPAPQPNDHTLRQNTIVQSLTVNNTPNVYHSSTNFQPVSSSSKNEAIPLKLPLGVEAFDQAYGGLPYGQVTEISGIPGIGKSQLAMQATLYAALPLLYLQPDVLTAAALLDASTSQTKTSLGKDTPLQHPIGEPMRYRKVYGGRVVYLDCEGGASPQRFAEMAEDVCYRERMTHAFFDSEDMFADASPSGREEKRRAYADAIAQQILRPDLDLLIDLFYLTTCCCLTRWADTTDQLLKLIQSGTLNKDSIPCHANTVECTCGNRLPISYPYLTPRSLMRRIIYIRCLDHPQLLASLRCVSHNCDPIDESPSSSSASTRPLSLFDSSPFDIMPSHVPPKPATSMNDCVKSNATSPSPSPSHKADFISSQCIQEYLDHSHPDAYIHRLPIRFVCIDSIAAHLRGLDRLDGLAFRSLIDSLREVLLLLKLNMVAILVVNQITTKDSPWAQHQQPMGGMLSKPPKQSIQIRLLPSLGVSWGTLCDNRIMLYWKHQSHRILHVLQTSNDLLLGGMFTTTSPSNRPPQRQFVFEVTSSGVSSLDIEGSEDDDIDGSRDTHGIIDPNMMENIGISGHHDADVVSQEANSQHTTMHPIHDGNKGLPSDDAHPITATTSAVNPITSNTLHAQDASTLIHGDESGQSENEHENTPDTQPFKGYSQHSSSSGSKKPRLNAVGRHT